MAFDDTSSWDSPNLISEQLYLHQAEEYGPLLGLKVAHKKTTVGPVAMAGFPFFQLDRFLKVLVQDQKKFVAVSEEFGVTFPKERRVARVITPGTLIDEKFLEPAENNFLLSVHPDDAGPGHTDSMPPDQHGVATRDAHQRIGLAWLDLSTGDFFTQTVSASSFPSALARIGAREIVLSPAVGANIREHVEMIGAQENYVVTLHECDTQFESMADWNVMLESPLDEDADLSFPRAEKRAGHQLLDYVRQRLLGQEMKLQPPRRRQLSEILNIDRHSLRGLEILQTARDGLGKGSLFHAVKRTTTKGGTRLLRDRLTSPSASLSEINERLDLVTIFYDNEDLRDELNAHLRRSYDVQRLVQKFALNKGDADDMVCLSRAIDATNACVAVIRSRLLKTDISTTPADSQNDPIRSVSRLLDRIDVAGPTRLSGHIQDAIDEDELMHKHELEEDEAAQVAALAEGVALRHAAPEELDALPKAVRSRRKAAAPREAEPEMEEPWIMRRDASETLARLHAELDRLQQEKVGLAQELRTTLSAPSLTLQWRPGLGHICHVKSGNKSAGLRDVDARLVSSTKSTRSFYLADWTQLGGRLDQARLQIRAEEQRIFVGLRRDVVDNLVTLRRNAAVMDELDVACSLAGLAREQGFVRPGVNAGTSHTIIGGRHPTVQLGLAEQGRTFVSNDLFLGDGAGERVWLVTGPNMGGKSTFLRQNAVISILAQAGSYVPAAHAEVGLVDRLFSRVGAADDVARAQSTFMVEMAETATILRHATARSLVIVDEVGRGTDPAAGLAVAYACLHHLYHVNRCRTLFATHFHALADMTMADARAFPRLGRYCTDVRVVDGGGDGDHDDDANDDPASAFTFVHRLRPGVNRRSHALQVARLAGLPASALDVARAVLRDRTRLSSPAVAPPEDEDELVVPTTTTAAAAAANGAA